MTLNRGSRYRVLGHALLYALGCAVMLALAAPQTRKLSVHWTNFVLGTAASLGALGLSALFVRWDGVRLRDIGITLGSRSLPRFGLGCMGGLFLVALQSTVTGLATHVLWQRTTGVGVVDGLMVSATCLALACREELAFHGYPLRRLETPFGLWGSQLIVASLFATEHVVGGVTWWHALLGAGVGSLLFGMAALTTRGLAMPIGLHFAWNFGQWMLGEKESSGLWEPVLEKQLRARFEMAGTISYVVVMASATLVFYLWHQGRRKAGFDS